MGCFMAELTARSQNRARPFLAVLTASFSTGVRNLSSIGLQQQLLGHEADAGILDAGQCLDGGLNFGGAVRAVDFDLEFLLHGGSLLYI